MGFFRWAARPGRNQRIDWDPSEDLARPAPRPGKPRVATDDQLRRCLDLLVHPALRVVRRAVILAAGAGMRASEIAAAEREDFNPQRVLILGKGEKGRAVPLIPDVWKEVAGEPPGRLITKVDAASDPSRIDSDQVREVSFDGDRMILRPPPRQGEAGEEYRELTWERIAEE